MARTGNSLGGHYRLKLSLSIRVCSYHGRLDSEFPPETIDSSRGNTNSRVAPLRSKSHEGHVQSGAVHRGDRVHRQATGGLLEDDTYRHNKHRCGRFRDAPRGELSDSSMVGSHTGAPVTLSYLRHAVSSCSTYTRGERDGSRQEVQDQPPHTERSVRGHPAGVRGVGKGTSRSSPHGCFSRRGLPWRKSIVPPSLKYQIQIS
jgi:hypothetical protein